MNWLFGLGGGGDGKANPLIATSGKWLATLIAIYMSIFWTPDIWAYFEDALLRAIHARYEGTNAAFVYWLLKVAAYPLMFFGARMALGVGFVSLVMAVMTKLFGGRR
jgi:hypothetical protein